MHNTGGRERVGLAGGMNVNPRPNKRLAGRRPASLRPGPDNAVKDRTSPLRPLVAWVGGIFAAVLIAVLSTKANAWLNPDPPPPTGTRVTTVPQQDSGTPSQTTPATGAATHSPSRPATPSAATSYTGPPGTGWSQTPTNTANDFLSVVAKMAPGDMCAGATGWAFPQTWNHLADLDPQDIDAWARRNGGVPESGNFIELTVTARNHARVVIDHIGVHVKERSKPKVRTDAKFGGCGGFSPAFFAVNLDSPLTPVKAIRGDDPDQPVLPAPLPHLLNDHSSVEVWRLLFNTRTCDCQFVPYFTWSSDGISGTYEVTNHGKPWRVTSVIGVQKATPLEHGWERY